MSHRPDGDLIWSGIGIRSRLRGSIDGMKWRGTTWQKLKNQPAADQALHVAGQAPLAADPAPHVADQAPLAADQAPLAADQEKPEADRAQPVADPETHARNKRPGASLRRK